MGEDRSIIYFVRHGEDVGNILRTIVSPDEGILTETGRLQAKLLGEHLKDEEFTAAFSSTYPRTSETAQIVLSQSSQSSTVNVVQDSRIVEQNWGIWERKPVKEGFKEFITTGKEYTDFTYWKPEGGENGPEILERIDPFLKEVFDIIDKSEKPQKILIVSHGGVYLALWKLLPLDPRFILKGWKPEMYLLMGNGTYFKVAVQKLPKGVEGEEPVKREWEILEAHGREHLKPLAKPDTMVNYTKEESSMSSFKGCVQQ